MMSFNSGRLKRRPADKPAPTGAAGAARGATPQPPAAPVVDDDPSFGWHASSLDLRLGCQVSEKPMDTLPGELLDSFFRR